MYDQYKQHPQYVGTNLNQLPPGMDRFLRQFSELFERGASMSNGGDSMVTTMRALESSNGVFALGSGTNRRVYRDDGLVYKIPFKIEGRQDNITELLCTLHLAYSASNMMSYIAPTTRFLDNGRFIIAQDYVRTFEQLHNETTGRAPGSGIFALVSIMQNWDMYCAMVHALSRHFIIMDINPYSAAFNIAPKHSNICVIDYGFFYPIPSGDIPRCPHCQAPLEYVLPDRIDPNKLQIEKMNCAELKDILVQPNKVTDMYKCSSKDPSCPHTTSRSDTTRVGGYIPASDLKRYYIAKYGTPEIALNNIQKYGYIPQISQY
ncbi:MAG: hypothetical protein ACRCZ9_08245 [Fusobacteriaceae bacterium]